MPSSVAVGSGADRLRPGDVVRLEIEGIGSIENAVIAGPALPPVTPARVRPRNRTRAEA